MTTKLWEASKNQKNNSNLFRYENFLNQKYKIRFNKNYLKLHGWSVKNCEKFWNSIWDFSNIKGKKIKKFYKSKELFKNRFFFKFKIKLCRKFAFKK